MLSELGPEQLPWRNQIISLERDIAEVPHAELEIGISGEGRAAIINIAIWNCTLKSG